MPFAPDWFFGRCRIMNSYMVNTPLLSTVDTKRQSRTYIKTVTYIHNCLSVYVYSLYAVGIVRHWYCLQKQAYQLYSKKRIKITRYLLHYYRMHDIFVLIARHTKYLEGNHEKQSKPKKIRCWQHRRCP